MVSSYQDALPGSLWNMGVIEQSFVSSLHVLIEQIYKDIVSLFSQKSVQQCYFQTIVHRIGLNTQVNEDLLPGKCS